MRKTEIGKGKFHNQGGQEFKPQTVQTPFGELIVPGFVRVPRMDASARTWRIWKERFVDFKPKEKTLKDVFSDDKKRRRRAAAFLKSKLNGG